MIIRIFSLLCIGWWTVAGLGVPRLAAQLPDLAPVRWTTDRSPTVGQNLLVTAYMTNRGDGVFNGGETLVYDRLTLSTTSTTNGAVAHWDRSFSLNVNAHADYLVYHVVTLPGDISAGAYYLILEADARSLVAESNEANNVFVVPVDVRSPDLVPVKMLQYRVPTVGQTLLVTALITNRGDGFVYSGLNYVYDRLTLSTTPNTNGAIARAEGGYYLYIGAYATYSQNISIPFPRDITPGAYYLIWETDVRGFVAEGNEGNNTLVAQVDVKLPDLEPLSLAWDRVPTAGQTLKVSALMTNHGDGFAYTWDSYVYDRLTLSTTPSTNNAVGSWDFSTGFDAASHWAYMLNCSILLPNNIGPGAYYLIWETDREGLVTESNEGNNAVSVPVEIQLPDLVPVSLTWDSVPTVGGRLSITSLVTNRGEGLIGSRWYDRINLSSTPSTNQAIYRRDFEINRSVPPHASFVESIYLDIPSDAKTGTYYLIYEVDQLASSTNSVAESDETNNTLVVPVNIAIADLELLSLSLDRVPVIGQPFYLSILVTNRGEGITLGWIDRVSLSPTPSINHAVYRRDVPIYGNLGPHDSFATSGLAVGLPSTYIPGIYYLFYETDTYRNVAESNETNNMVMMQISIGVAELVPGDLHLNSPAIAGRPLSVSWIANNPSFNPLIGQWNDQLILSTNMTTNGAVVIWPYNGSFNVESGGSYSRARTVDIPEIQAGNYYLILQLDAGGAVSEGNETNNTVVLPILVTNIAPRVTLLNPTNHVDRKICVPTSFPLAAGIESGSYSVRRVEFLINGVEAARSTNAPFRAVTPVLPPGNYRITARVVDTFELRADSPEEATMTLTWPAALELVADLDKNGDLICCMGTQPGSNYVIQSATTLREFTDWQDYLTNGPAGGILIFTNHPPLLPQRYFRGRGAP